MKIVDLNIKKLNNLQPYKMKIILGVPIEIKSGLNIISSLKKEVFLFACVFLCIVNVFSQESRPAVEEVWFQYYNNSKITDKWGVSSDVGYLLKEGRFYDLSQYFMRSGASYTFNPMFKITLGGAYFKTHFHGVGKAEEFRPHQQLNTKHKIGKIGFGNRVRIEQRFINIAADAGEPAESTFNFRFRYRFMFDFPLINLSHSNKERKLSFVVGDEILFSAGKGEFFDFSVQNRFLVGPVVKFNKQNKLFVYYNFTAVSKDIPDISDEYGILWLGYKQTLDFRK